MDEQLNILMNYFVLISRICRDSGATTLFMVGTTVGDAALPVLIGELFTSCSSLLFVFVL